MSYKSHGKHLIAGEWEGDDTSFFSNQPVRGEADSFNVGTVELVSKACEQADAAFPSFSSLNRESRADFLQKIAEEIEKRSDDIADIATKETGLPEARIVSERGRTVSQILLFAETILRGDYLDRRHDQALPQRQPLPRPDIKLIQRPIGPVAVFGASNFPLAFSVAGGDTISALAAGCPVVVKGHSAHPGTCEVVADAVRDAVKKSGLHPGVFSLIQGGRRDVGSALVQDPRIKAVGFTGGVAGGRALFDLCASRPEPIPFFGELGSVNPLFVLPTAANWRGAEIGRNWVNSLTMGAGQFCTKPGILVCVDGTGLDALIEAASAAASKASPQTMLTTGIADAFKSGRSRFEKSPLVKTLVSNEVGVREASTSIFETSAKSFASDHTLSEEVFGALGLVVRARDIDELIDVAKSFSGQLTATMQMEPTDENEARKLVPILERMAGRLIINGFPTGVEVCDAMVHGGPYPASTNFGATSVGTMAIRRFLRPVSYQNFPDSLLPELF